MRKDGRLRKILAKTNVNFVFECTNLIDSFRVNWLTRIIHNRFSPTLDHRPCGIILRRGFHLGSCGCGWSVVISSETDARLKRDVRQVAN